MGSAESAFCAGTSKMSSGASTAAAAAAWDVGAFCWKLRLWTYCWVRARSARGGVPASCGRDTWDVQAERASLLALEAALKHAVRILASVEGGRWIDSRAPLSLTDPTSSQKKFRVATEK